MNRAVGADFEIEKNIQAKTTRYWRRQLSANKACSV